MRSVAAVVGTHVAGFELGILCQVFGLDRSDGAPVDDAMIEIWQADSQGRYAHPAEARGGNLSFKGFGRCGTGTDPENRFVFDSVKPGAVDEAQSPHVNVIVFMRGLLSRWSGQKPSGKHLARRT